MARPKLNDSGAFVWSVSIDKETHRMIKKLAKETGVNNQSAVVRMAIRELYKKIIG
ncbi:ribbon-helix-helix protein, CopG family [Thermococcus sp. CX2]|uniref:ribbon-helix-helix protein, CopG family n=1 Tax=Thermococcus sp. CX2 TaxID=163006 RepID=UPI001439C7D5|nr:ribbon-helix-helix protein, CopG family [Thermococcus sp. CX2]NJE84358.1 ribbon-helix-helix protein, CopG family [Thermococcus sp. CX2]